MEKLYKSKRRLAGAIFFTIMILSTALFGYSGGISGRTQKSGTNGCSCHGSKNTGVTVTLTGASVLTPNMQSTYTVTISGGPLASGGVDIAASAGTLINASTDCQVMSGEVTQMNPKMPVSGSVTFQFKYTAPATTGAQTLYVTGLSINNDGGTSGDQFNFAPNFTVNVNATLPVELTSFAAAVVDKSIKLNWHTATELNNSGYQIQRKNSGSGWQVIAFVNGNGTTTTGHDYSYVDNVTTGNGQYVYRLNQLDNDGQSTLSKEVEVDLNFAPGGYSMDQNYPNPFNPSTSIRYSLPDNAFVSIKIYNSTGKEVATLVNGMQSADFHQVTFDASKLGSGVYYYTIKAGNNFVQTRKMLLLK
jgi:predicted carbohydrate-binding protein with CBM5 and CBM33 domain